MGFWIRTEQIFGHIEVTQLDVRQQLLGAVFSWNTKRPQFKIDILRVKLDDAV